MKYRTVLILLSLILVFMLFAAIGSLIANIILGYSGFKNIKSKENLIELQPNCTNTYFTQRYNLAFSTSKQIIFIFNIVECATILISLILVCCSLRCCRKNQNGRQQTRIEQLQSAQNQREIESHYLQIQQVVLLFILIAISIMTSYVGSYTYLRVLLDGRSDICIITYNEREILALCILYFVTLALGVAAFIIIIYMGQKQRKKDEMAEAEVHSLSYREEVQRIIRQIPQSERRFAQNQQRGHLSRELGRLPNATNSQRNRPEQPSEHLSQNPRIDNVQRVKSIIYQVDPELMLESIARAKQS